MKIRIFSALFLALGLWIGSAHASQAATLYVSPGTGTYRVGQTFTVTIGVSSPDQAVNAVSGVVRFPNNLLQLTSLSKSGVVSLWVQDPTFSQAAGTASFEGVILNPGYKGGGGKLITLTFRAKATGDATVSLASGQVLANDGQGTNILSGLGRGKYRIDPALPAPTPKPTPEPVPVPPPVPVPAPLPPPPPIPGPLAITSQTYPDPTRWYAVREGVFQWTVLSGVTGVSYVVDQSPLTVPDTTAEGLVASVAVRPEHDGVWYLHLRGGNATGWGEATHYRFQIDSAPPAAFEVKPLPRPDLTQPTTVFLIDATDTTSGLEYYDIRIDDGQAAAWRDTGSHLYETPALAPGKHLLSVSATDRAGNVTTATAAWEIEVLSPPRITDFPPVLPSESWLVIHGSSLARVTVHVVLVDAAGQRIDQPVVADERGNWLYVSSEKIKEGEYRLYAIAEDARGVQSARSEEVQISVRQPWFWLLGSLLTNPIIFWFLILFLIFIILLLLIYHRYAMHRLEKRMLQQMNSLQQTVSQHLEQTRGVTDEGNNQQTG